MTDVAALKEAAERACARIAPTWPLDRFIAVNPFWPSTDKPLPEVAGELAALSGARLLMPREWYAEEWRAGRLRFDHLWEAIAESGKAVTEDDLIALFWILRGWDGAWSAAVGVIVVVINFLLAGAILSISARISLAAYHAAALIGFFLRLGLLTLTMLLIAEFLPIDRLAFGITAVVTYLFLIGAEMVAMTKGKERELEWT